MTILPVYLIKTRARKYAGNVADSAFQDDSIMVFAFPDERGKN